MATRLTGSMASNAGSANDTIFAVAPMMDCTDRHYRYLARLLSKRTLLYTEMVNMGAVLFGDTDKFLKFNDTEHPVALQLGGSDPKQLAQCANIAEQYGYDEVNLNVGCPSDRVQAGRFGACLMLEPDLVAECVHQMKSAVTIPVTVKCRIGVDDQDPNQVLPSFVEKVMQAGCLSFSVHARKAWLKGLSPKENREVPPLDYNLVYALKRQFPKLCIVINGGIQTLQDAASHSVHVDGVMLGRAVYTNPYLLATVDTELYADQSDVPSRAQILDQYIEYVANQRANEHVYLKHMSRHLMGLYHGEPGAKGWRQALSENARYPDASVQVIQEARKHVSSCD